MISRYRDPAIGSIEQCRYEQWARVELAALRAQFPAYEDACPELQALRPDTQQVVEQEAECGHEMIAFLRAWQAKIRVTHPNSDSSVRRAARKIHYRLASSDVQDTALGLQVIAYTGRIEDQLWDLIRRLERIANEGSATATPQVGRTHGQWAEVRTLEHWFGVQSRVGVRLRRRLCNGRDDAAKAKFSGPVGASGLSYAARARAVEFLGAADLSLICSTQIVPRDGLAAWAHVLSDLATFCEAIALQVWLWAQAEVQEVREGVRVGSSSMPHKRNPVGSENIRGLARMARSRAAELQLGMMQFGDHDLSHSSVERVAIPDLAHLTATALVRTTQLVDGLEWNRARLELNVFEAQQAGVGSYDRLVAAVDGGMDYLEAHEALSRGDLT